MSTASGSAFFLRPVLVQHSFRNGVQIGLGSANGFRIVETHQAQKYLLHEVRDVSGGVVQTRLKKTAQPGAVLGSNGADEGLTVIQLQAHLPGKLRSLYDSSVEVVRMAAWFRIIFRRSQHRQPRWPIRSK